MARRIVAGLGVMLCLGLLGLWWLNIGAGVPRAAAQVAPSEIPVTAGVVTAQAYPPQFAAQGEGGVRDALVTGVSDDAGGQLAAALPARSFLIRQVFGGGPQEPGRAGYFALGALRAVVRP